jgi:hypothetical protein
MKSRERPKELPLKGSEGGGDNGTEAAPRSRFRPEAADHPAGVEG